MRAQSNHRDDHRSQFRRAGRPRFPGSRDRVLPRGEPALHPGRARLFGGGSSSVPWVCHDVAWQLPFDQGRGRTDVPGLRRRRPPALSKPLLSVMGRSRLFERARRSRRRWSLHRKRRLRLLARQYQPPSAPPRRPLRRDHRRQRPHVPRGVRPVGARRVIFGMTLDSAGTTAATTGRSRARKTRARMRFDALRISVSWRYVFHDAEQRRRTRGAKSARSTSIRWSRLDFDLARADSFRAADPLHDEAFVEAARAYVREPTVFEA